MTEDDDVQSEYRAVNDVLLCVCVCVCAIVGTEKTRNRAEKLGISIRSSIILYIFSNLLLYLPL